MLSKVLMSFGDELGSMIRGGSILRWHKSDGDWIEYGDGLFDLRVEEVAVSQQLKAAGIRFATANFDARGVAKLAEEQLQGRDFEMDRDSTAGAEVRQQRVFMIRVTSSDSGRLAKICARPHQRQEYGALLALVTTHAGEIAAEDDLALSKASDFRVVANAFEDVEDSVVEAAPAQTTGRVGPGEHAARNHAIFWSRPDAGRRLGIYTSGSHSLLPIFACKAALHERVDGRCCIMRDNPLSLRSDLLLELSEGPHPKMSEVLEQMGFGPDHLRCRMFDPEFHVDGPLGRESFPQRVVFISAGPDVIRPAYRHREHGFLFDLGRHWLNRRLSAALDRRAAPMPWSTAKQWADQELPWFREHFESIGRLSVAEFFSNLSRVVTLVRERTGAHVVLANVLATAPDNPIWNYQFSHEPAAPRRLEFNLAVAELSRDLDVPVLDVDRMLKRKGIRRQVDWEILDPALFPELADEAVGILGDLGVA